MHRVAESSVVEGKVEVDAGAGVVRLGHPAAGDRKDMREDRKWRRFRGTSVEGSVTKKILNSFPLKNKATRDNVLNC